MLCIVSGGEQAQVELSEEKRGRAMWQAKAEALGELTARREEELAAQRREHESAHTGLIASHTQELQAVKSSGEAALAALVGAAGARAVRCVCRELACVLVECRYVLG